MNVSLGNFHGIGRSCTRWVGGGLGAATEQVCGEQATRHVIWNAETMDNSYACEEHAEEAATRWRCYAHHELGPCCGMPGALFMFEENVCRYPGDELPVTETVEREVLA